MSPDELLRISHRRDFVTITVKDTFNVDFNIKYFFKNIGSNKLDTYLVIQVEEMDSVVYYTSKKLKPIYNQWSETNINVSLRKFPNYYVLTAYVYNKNSTLLLDDYKLAVRF